MPVLWTRYGRDAYEALRDQLTEAKRHDPLAQVTVLVPTHLSGVVTRRTLARGVAGHSGVAGVSVLTVPRLAEQIAAPALVGSGRRPAIGPVLAAAWRKALTEDAGVFAPVAEHRATVRALVEAHRELRDVDDDGLDAIARSGAPIAADLVRLHRRVGAILADGWYDTVDLCAEAAVTLRADPTAARRIGKAVLFLPQELGPAAIDLLRALARSAGLRVIAALTGDKRADAAVRDAAEQIVGELALAPKRPTETVTRVIHASDADDEVRCVVRDLVERLRSTRPHRVAVLYGPAEPYARLLAEHLAAAGLATNGTGVRPTIERTLSRTLLDLLELPDHGWRRDEVAALIASAPVRGEDGRRVPAARWDRISRAAGVVDGDDWQTRLAAYASQERAAAQRERTSDAPRTGVIARAERNAEAADALRAFVAGVRARLEAGARLRTWPELAAWAGETFRALVGEVDTEPWLPEDEARAAKKVEQVLSGVGGLGAIEAVADLTALRLTLELELADDLPRQGRFGTGVLVAPLSEAVGLDADVVYVVGLAEDVVPGRVREDALLPDRVRERAAGRLRPLRARIDRQHRHMLAAIAAAPECVASFPRGDLRRSSDRLPSRWLLPSLRALSGNPALSATRWASVDGPWLSSSPSYAASLSGTDTLATEQEWRTRAAVAGRAAGLDVREALPADDVVRRAVAMVRARGSAALTRFDGDLSGHAVPDPASADQVVSPTALEDWATCPHAFFMQRLLRVEPLESPEELVRISPIEIGSLVHEALDRFFAEQADAGAVPGGAQGWTPEQRRALVRIVGEVAGEFEARGVTGHRLLWRQERDRILVDLQGLLDDDEKVRAASGRRQIHSELAFGMDGADPVEVALRDGRTIRFRGSADRVDRAGDAIVVVDYKTGSTRRFQGLGEDDPTAGGVRLQLPVYAHAARAGLGAPHAPVSAEYWFVRRDRGTRKPLPLTEAVNRTHAEAVDEVGRLVSLREHCSDDSDKLLPRLDELAAWADRLASAPDDPARFTALNAVSRRSWRNVGRKNNWTSYGIDQLRAECAELVDRVNELRARMLEASLRRLARRVARDVLDAAQARREEGRLEFHDLLVLARELLRSPEHGAKVRAALQDRYRRLLLDEFQDADPIQIELAVRIAGGADASGEDWQQIRVPDGSLFIVGDPKQSIYRFRRADIATYLEAQGQIGDDVALQTNFRTTPPVLDWVNHVFGRLITRVEDSQPDYRPLREDREVSPRGPGVVVLAAEAHKDKPSADELRTREADDVVATVRAALAERWRVSDQRRLPDGHTEEYWRDVELHDIAVLVPARTSLPHLEAALDEAGIPYRAEASSLVYRTREIRDLLMAARAADDPSDALALVTTLRSTLFGCGDDDLWTWYQAGGRWNILAPPPEAVEETHPVRAAVAYLAKLHDARTWLTPSEVLGRLIDDRRIFETAVEGPRVRDVWRRLRFVIDQARAWAESEHGGLRAYLDWADRQGDEAARVAQAVLPETDTNTLRIMTIHAAKGLEFPVVIASGMSSRPGGARSGVEVIFPREGGCAMKLRKDLQTADFEVAKPIDEQMGYHERLRLLYVACTRARDHLVVSLHRPDRPLERVAERNLTNAELLAGASVGAPAQRRLEELVPGRDPSVPVGSVPVRAAPPPPYDEWRDEIQRVRSRAERPSAVSASQFEGAADTASPGPAAMDRLGEPIDPGLAKDARDLQLPP